MSFLPTQEIVRPPHPWPRVTNLASAHPARAPDPAGVSAACDRGRPDARALPSWTRQGLSHLHEQALVHAGRRCQNRLHRWVEFGRGGTVPSGAGRS